MIVVSNTSPLTNLAAIGQFDLLRYLYTELHIASGVWDELNAGGKPRRIGFNATQRKTRFWSLPCGVTWVAVRPKALFWP